jgi:hypothetical protein
MTGFHNGHRLSFRHVRVALYWRFRKRVDGGNLRVRVHIHHITPSRYVRFITVVYFVAPKRSFIFAAQRVRKSSSLA